MRTTSSPNKGHLPLPSVSEELLECAGRCGLVSQLSRREVRRATRFVCSTCHHDGRAPEDD